MPMDEARLREEICRVGASLYARGYVHATAGNISARSGDGFLITPTDACLGFLDPARLAKVEASGTAVAGDPPSKTLALHRRIYAADPASRCVIHTHSTHLVALTGWGQDEDRRRSSAAGFDDHLVKPVEIQVLAALLRSLEPSGVS